MEKQESFVGQGDDVADVRGLSGVKVRSCGSTWRELKITSTL